MVVEDKKEMTLRDFILLITNWLKYLKSKFLIILIFAIVGVAAGFARARFSKPKYKATSTFVLEEEKQGANSSGLALLGLGSGGSQGGLFQGDNLKWLYTTRAMVQGALLTQVDSGAKKMILLDWFLQFDKDVLKILKNEPDLKNLKFTAADADSLNNLDSRKNSLLAACYDIVKTKYLQVKDVEKTEGVIEVTIMSTDEHFAKNLADVLVQKVNSFYVLSKTQKLSTKVAELQLQANEYNTQMNASMYQTAAAVDAVPYPNPSQQVNLVKPKRKSVDVELNSAIYVQIIKNLETSKMELAQATPLIQVVDAPLFPLPTDRPKMLMNVILFALGGVILSVLFLIIKKLYKDAMYQQ